MKSCSISHCTINILVNFVPNKRFKLHQMGFQRRLVPRKRFIRYKVCTVWEKGGCITGNHLAGEMDCELDCELELADKQSVISLR